MCDGVCVMVCVCDGVCVSRPNKTRPFGRIHNNIILPANFPAIQYTTEEIQFVQSSVQAGIDHHCNRTVPVSLYQFCVGGCISLLCSTGHLLPYLSDHSVSML